MSWNSFGFPTLALVDEFWFRLMVFNVTLKNITIILWWSVLMVEETRVPRENH